MKTYEPWPFKQDGCFKAVKNLRPLEPGDFRPVLLLSVHGLRDDLCSVTDHKQGLTRSGGEWITSVDLENALVGNPAVKSSAVAALPYAK